MEIISHCDNAHSKTKTANHSFGYLKAMDSTMKYTKISAGLGFLLAMMVAIGSVHGIGTPDLYKKETIHWQAQSIGQDYFDLIVIPVVLLAASVGCIQRKTWALSVQAGVFLYLVYTFAIYCFSVHFNQLFILYCLVLGTSFFGFLFALRLLIAQLSPADIVTKLEKFTGYYFMTIAIAFYPLWISEVIPANANNTIPQALLDAGLPTNPVHVLDLSVVLPGIFMTGVLLLRKNILGQIMAPIVLTFFVLMDLTIAWLTMYMYQEGLVTGMAVAYIMVCLAGMSLLLLLQFLFLLQPGSGRTRSSSLLQ